MPKDGATLVPFPPGGPIDTMARLVAHELSTKLAQDVVVENRPGAGSTIGSKATRSGACLVRSRFTAWP
jgi:tripartite-type tricarboxylate transporter receptor subunit TctC